MEQTLSPEAQVTDPIIKRGGDVAVSIINTANPYDPRPCDDLCEEDAVALSAFLADYSGVEADFDVNSFRDWDWLNDVMRDFWRDMWE